MEWSVGQPEPLRSRRDPVLLRGVQPGHVAQRRHPVHHPHRRSRRRGDGGPAVGAVDEHGHHRHPLARRGRPHPPADAPQKGPHSDAGGGGVPQQPRSRRGRQRILVKGRTSKEMELVEDSPGEGGPPREAQDDGSGPRPERRRDRGHRRLAPTPPNTPRYKERRRRCRRRPSWCSKPARGAGSPSPPANRPCRPPRWTWTKYGRAVSSPVKAYHLSGRCYEDHRAAEKARREALLAA